MLKSHESISFESCPLLTSPIGITNKEIVIKSKVWHARWGYKDRLGKDVEIDFENGKCGGVIEFYEEFPKELGNYYDKFKLVKGHSRQNKFVDVYKFQFGDYFSNFDNDVYNSSEGQKHDISERLKYPPEQIKPMSMDIKKLADYINNHKIVFYTGAGISMSGGVYGMDELNKSLGIDTHSRVDEIVYRALENPKLILDPFKTFCNAAFNGRPTEAHVSLATIAKYKHTQVLTENFDFLQERAGIIPWSVSGPRLHNEIAPNLLKQIDAVILIGQSSDNRGFLNWYRNNNDKGILISLDIGTPKYLSEKDYLIKGDLQKTLPELERLLIK